MNSRFSRQNIFYDILGAHEIKESIFLKKRVMLLGCGGIGNYISYGLADAGVGHLILVDGDIIEESNLNRQCMFTSSDVGDRKVHVLK